MNRINEEIANINVMRINQEVEALAQERMGEELSIAMLVQIKVSTLLDKAILASPTDLQQSALQGVSSYFHLYKLQHGESYFSFIFGKKKIYEVDPCIFLRSGEKGFLLLLKSGGMELTVGADEFSLDEATQYKIIKLLRKHYIYNDMEHRLRDDLLTKNLKSIERILSAKDVRPVIAIDSFNPVHNGKDELTLNGIVPSSLDKNVAILFPSFLSTSENPFKDMARILYKLSYILGKHANNQMADARSEKKNIHTIAEACNDLIKSRRRAVDSGSILINYMFNYIYNNKKPRDRFNLLFSSTPSSISNVPKDKVQELYIKFLHCKENAEKSKDQSDSYYKYIGNIFSLNTACRSGVTKPTRDLEMEMQFFKVLERIFLIMLNDLAQDDYVVFNNEIIINDAATPTEPVLPVLNLYHLISDVSMSKNRLSSDITETPVREIQCVAHPLLEILTKYINTQYVDTDSLLEFTVPASKNIEESTIDRSAMSFYSDRSSTV